VSCDSSARVLRGHDNLALDTVAVCMVAVAASGASGADEPHSANTIAANGRAIYAFVILVPPIV